MQTEVFRIETPEQFSAAVEKAAELLKRGEVVVVPTETVYGLAANALHESAVRRIYDVKGRPSDNPIIVHIASIAVAKECASNWTGEASALAAAFWPGPLTLVLPKSSAIPPIVTAGGNTVGLRWPAHPFMRELIQRSGFPVAAPSANLANAVSPTAADHAIRTLNGKVRLIVDAGPSNVGIESTVLDLTVEPPRVLRAGMISAQQISRVLGREILDRPGASVTLKSPGLMRRHYAPHARLVIKRWSNETELRTIADQFEVPLSRVSIIAHDRVPQANPFGRVAIIPHDPEAYARALYAELHRCDELGAKLIIVEEVPATGEWQGIRDRLSRASATD